MKNALMPRTPPRRRLGSLRPWHSAIGAIGTQREGSALVLLRLQTPAPAVAAPPIHIHARISSIFHSHPGRAPVRLDVHLHRQLSWHVARSLAPSMGLMYMQTMPRGTPAHAFSAPWPAPERAASHTVLSARLLRWVLRRSEAVHRASHVTHRTWLESRLGGTTEHELRTFAVQQARSLAQVHREERHRRLSIEYRFLSSRSSTSRALHRLLRHTTLVTQALTRAHATRHATISLLSQRVAATTPQDRRHGPEPTPHAAQVPVPLIPRQRQPVQVHAQRPVQLPMTLRRTPDRAVEQSLPVDPQDLERRVQRRVLQEFRQPGQVQDELRRALADDRPTPQLLQAVTERVIAAIDHRDAIERYRRGRA